MHAKVILQPNIKIMLTWVHRSRASEEASDCIHYVVKSLCCEEGAHGCPLCFSFYEASFFAQSALDGPQPDQDCCHRVNLSNLVSFIDSLKSSSISGKG